MLGTSPFPSAGDHLFTITNSAEVEANSINIVVETAPAPGMYNYVPFIDVKDFFTVTDQQLEGFAGEDVPEKLLSKGNFIAYMASHPQYNGIDFGTNFTSIAQAAFVVRGAGEDLSLPECVEAIKFSNDISIGVAAFMNNLDLEEINFGNGNISIDMQAFYGCINLSKISVG
jgi:hypothetical protein